MATSDANCNTVSSVALFGNHDQQRGGVMSDTISEQFGPKEAVAVQR